MGLHVLLVEDSAIAASALRVLLEESGYRVTVAGTVKSAIVAGALDRADALLLDLSLPDGDGVSIVDALRERSALPATVFAMTGRDDDDTRERCEAAGCAAVLVKPVPIRELVERLREELLDRPRAT